jgi:hypothetical protein
MPSPKDSPVLSTTTATEEDAGEGAGDGADGDPGCLLPCGHLHLMGRTTELWAVKLEAMAIPFFGCESPILTGAGVISLS